MRTVGIFGAAVTALAIAFAAGGAWAQSATSQHAGKPPAVLAGLRPPHEFKHRETRHAAQSKIEHGKTAHGKTAAATRRGRMAAEHTRHFSARNTAKKEYENRERFIAASAFAEGPAAQTAPNPAPTDNWPAVNPNSSADGAVAPAPASPPADGGPDPSAMQVNGQPAQVNSRLNSLDLAAQHDAPSRATPSDHAGAAPAPQTALAAPARDEVGNASWIAQLLAALGGAVAAGAVAWFLIGAGPVRTYG